MSVVTETSMITVNSTTGKTAQSTCSNKRKKEHIDNQHIPQQNEECEIQNSTASSTRLFRMLFFTGIEITSENILTYK